MEEKSFAGARRREFLGLQMCPTSYLLVSMVHFQARNLAYLIRGLQKFTYPSFHKRNAMDWQAFWLTTRLAVLVAATLVVVGLPIAYWIAYSRWRWKFLVEAVVALPIVLPPTVLGLYVLM